MHKSLAFIGIILLSNSVLVPLTANAQTTQAASPITTDSSAASAVTTNQVDPVQDPIELASYKVTLTSYNAVPSQTDSTPDTTSIGVATNPEVVAARSRDLAAKLPYGTIIEIDGPAHAGGATCGYSTVQHLIGYRVIADAMNARMHNKIDVLLDPSDKVSVGYRKINPSIALGACTGVTIRVVGYVDPAHMPETQEGLAALVEGSQHLAYATF